MIDVRRLDDPNMCIDRESMRQYIYATHGDDKDGRAFAVWAEKRAAHAQSDEGKPWHQHGYLWPDLLRHVRKIDAFTHTKNMYISLQSFQGPFRRPENLFRLNGIGFDYDFHDTGTSIETMFDAFARLEADVFNGIILPPPSLVVFTGRGFQMIYLLEPLPKQGLPLWKMVGKAIAERIEDCISRHKKDNILMGHLDQNYSDVTRVLRVAGTPNTEAQCYAVLMMPDADTEPVRYRLDALRDAYIPELMLKPKRQSEQLKERKKCGEIKRLYNLYSLHWARLNDIVILRDLRKESDLPEDFRKRMIFLYRYWGCICVGPETALENALAFNQNFRTPLPERIVEQATLSAQNAYERWLTDRTKGYNYRNDTLIKLLEISEEEQRHLSTIVGKKERKRRQQEKNWYHQQREAERKEQREKQQMEIIELRERGLTYREISAEIGMTVGKIGRIVRANGLRRENSKGWHEKRDDERRAVRKKEEACILEFLQQEYTYQEIAEMVGVTRKKISRVAEQYGYKKTKGRPTRGKN